MKYAFLLAKTTYDSGDAMFVVKDQMLMPEEVLEPFKKKGYTKCKFWSIIPAGMHLCACGTVTMGDDDDLLCKNCRDIYGHRYASEL